MKTYIIFSVILTVSWVHANADNQDVAHNLTVVEGRNWNYLVKGIGGPTTESNFEHLATGYHFSGRRILNEKEYNIFRDNHEQEIAYMREEDRKVYLYYNDSLPYQVWDNGNRDETVGEIVIYDFSLEDNDIFSCFGFDDMANHIGMEFEAKVIAIGSVSFEENTFQYQDFRIMDDEINDQTVYRNIEGMGNLCGLLPFPQFGNKTSGLVKESEYLLSVTDEDGKIIFENPDIKNLSYVETPITEDDSNTTQIIYDLHGREIANIQPGSVYIRNGKKFVAK